MWIKMIYLKKKYIITTWRGLEDEELVDFYYLICSILATNGAVIKIIIRIKFFLNIFNLFKGLKRVPIKAILRDTREMIKQVNIFNFQTKIHYPSNWHFFQTIFMNITFRNHLNHLNWGEVLFLIKYRKLLT